MAELVNVIREQFLDDNGDPLAGGLLYSYEAGTSTPKATYKDLAGSEANTNPIVLDSAGRPPYDVRFTTGTYKFVLKDSLENTIWTVDDVQTFASYVTTAGALAVAENLADLADVPTAWTNLGIDPLTTPVTTAITSSMGATSISGYNFTGGESWVHIEYFVTRNSAAVLGSGDIDLHYDGAAWQIVEGPYNYLSGKATSHGLTFSMSGNQLQVAADASGNGSLITKYHKV